MSAFYSYLVVGIALIALEIATTTFYLLIIGIACILGSFIAFFMGSWLIPTIVVGILSIIGCFLVKAYKHQGSNDDTMLVDHTGQEVVVIEVLPTHVKVLYSGSYWDAVVKDVPLSQIKVGDYLKIKQFGHNKFEVGVS